MSPFLPPDARDRGLSRLYHYQRFDPKLEVDRFRLKSIIVDHTVYFSNVAEFNDPWDCRPWFSLPHSPLERKKLVANLLESHRKRFPNQSELRRKKIADQLLADDAMLRATVEKMSRGMWEALQKQYRVYCLAQKPDCPLMWAHYGGSHSGICLEYDATNSIFADAMEVEYYKEYPPYKLFDDDVLLPFRAKSDRWNYEAEFRLVSEEIASAKSTHTIKTENGLYRFPPEALLAVIIGNRATPLAAEIIDKNISEIDRHLAVRRVEIRDDRYELIVK
jgi:hypothetical protein